MKRAIFFIEDELGDVRGMLLTVEAILANARTQEFKNAPQLNEVMIFFLHLIWKEDAEKIEQYKKQFAEIYAQVKEFAFNDFVEIKYQEVKLPCTREENNHKPCLESILNAKSELMTQWDSIPEAKYTVLLDVILNTQLDESVLTEALINPDYALSTLSLELFHQFKSMHCIAYTKYSIYNILKKWWALAKLDDPSAQIPYERDVIRGSRGIHIGFRKQLCENLNILEA